MQSHNNRATIGKLLIFSAVAISAGWIGLGLDLLLGASHSQGPGQLLWLVMPLLTAVLLRTFTDDGWKDSGVRVKLTQNAVWYTFSLLLFPFSAALTLVIGLITGLTTVPAYSPAIGGFFLKTVFLGLLPSFVKNIFEEFAWRGYLAPRISSLGINDLAGHALAGLVWATWHVPYYLFFLDRASFTAYTSQSFTTFFPMLFAGVLAMSFVYGEILLLTHSVWPLLLLHTVSNAIGSPLLLNGLIRMAPGAEVFVSPAPGSVISIIVYCAIGTALYRFRLGKKKRGSNSPPEKKICRTA
ncbi:MAG: CPBP family intramembrane glutamic endopeptidase [Chlorobiaceae bacterium]